MVNRMINPEKKFKDLKNNQIEKISNWLFDETLSYYQSHHCMPDKQNRKRILDTVYCKIKSASIWIPYEEIRRYYLSKLIQYEKRIQRKMSDL